MTGPTRHHNRRSTAITTKTKINPNSAAAVIERAEAARKVLADANALWREREAALVAAKEAVAWIENGWRRGDDTATAADLVNAQAEVTRSLSLIDGARFAAQRAGRGLINDNPTLAAAVVHALGGEFNGVPVKPLTVEPTIPDAEDLPVAYVVDTNPETKGRSGEVEFVIYGPRYLGKPDPEEFATLLRKGGTSLSGGGGPRFSTTHHGGMLEHRAHFRVAGAHPALPHWADPKPEAREALQRLAESFSDYMGEVSGPGKWGLGSSLPIASRFDFGRVTGSTPAGTGLTDTTVEIDMDLRTSTWGKTKNAAVEIREELLRDASRYAQAWAETRGRQPHVQSVKVVRTDAGSGSQIPIRMTLVLRSRDNALTLADVDQ